MPDFNVSSQSSNNFPSKKSVGLQLNQREIECMTHAMHNKNLSQIAEILNISPRTVYFYLKNVSGKISELNQQVFS